MLNSVNLSHYDLIKKIQHLFKRWSPAVFIGYNTINFDERILRKTFLNYYLNLISPNLMVIKGLTY